MQDIRRLEDETREELDRVISLNPTECSINAFIIAPKITRLFCKSFMFESSKLGIIFNDFL